MITSSYLTDEQVAFYHENGFLVIEGFLNEVGDKSVQSLREAISQVTQQMDFSAQAAIFSTTEDKHAQDDYFLESSDKIRFFWEENAWKAGHLTTTPELAINKIGHNLHDLEPAFEAVSYDSRVGRICRELGQEKPLVVQSMYIFKQPHIGGEVGAHQDGAFLYTEPQSVLGFWWALDKCTKNNGCLWAVPGSHRLGVHRRFRRRDDGQGCEFVPKEPVTWDLSQAVPIECPAGTLVLIHAGVVHYSEDNISADARHAYSIHVIDGKEGVAYPADNWLQREQSFKEIK